MRRLIKPIFWTILFLAMMLAIDQFLVQVPPIHPAHAAVRNFYQDFRSRLIDLAFNEKKAEPKTIEAVIEKRQKDQKVAPKKSVKTEAEQTGAASRPQGQKPQRYLYSDGKGELHFVDSMDEVPDEYRGQAQPMGK